MPAQPLQEFLLRQLEARLAQPVSLLATPNGFSWTALTPYLSTASTSIWTNDWRCWYASQNAGFNSYFTASANLEKLTGTSVLFWPKAKEEGYWWLAQIATLADEIYLIGANNGGVNAVAKQLQQAGAQVSKLDSARRCSLYVVTGLSKLKDFLQEGFSVTTHSIFGLSLASQPGIFNQGRLDLGTELLINSLQEQAPLATTGAVLDLGCGNGVIGAWLLHNFSGLNLTATDVNGLALRAAQSTFAANKLEAQVLGADIFTGLADANTAPSFNLIVSNPPFHTGKATDYELSARFIRQAPKFLAKGGELRIVANSFLPYPELLDQAFGSHKCIAATTKFKVYQAIKA